MKMSLHVATSLGISQRQIEQCIQFARKYPDLSLMNTGKNISWHKITQELLPEHVESISKPVTKAELIQCLKDIKTLLQHEWETYNQEIINGGLDMSIENAKCDYIHYLQDQFNKLTSKVDLTK
jgi:hypothetical protein